MHDTVVLMAKRCTALPSCAKCPKRGMRTSSQPAGEDCSVVEVMLARAGTSFDPMAALVPSPQSTAVER